MKNDTRKFTKACRSFLLKVTSTHLPFSVVNYFTPKLEESPDLVLYPEILVKGSVHPSKLKFEFCHYFLSHDSKW